MTKEEQLQKAAEEIYPTVKGQPSFINAEILRERQAFISGATSPAAQQYWQGWVEITKPLEIGSIVQRWHKVWNIPITVKYMPDNLPFPWVEKTLMNCWPEESFTNHYLPLPSPPKTDQR